mmetsp:Transcript_30997/g.65757  ORF Transcript_30997/g.65757 Transcript_30997/m.65757 type:complete len:82 (-) Transcript_30997:193-438(-)
MVTHCETTGVATYGGGTQIWRPYIGSGCAEIGRCGMSLLQALSCCCVLDKDGAGYLLCHCCATWQLCIWHRQSTLAAWPWV